MPHERSFGVVRLSLFWPQPIQSETAPERIGLRPLTPDISSVATEHSVGLLRSSDYRKHAAQVCSFSSRTSRLSEEMVWTRSGGN